MQPLDRARGTLLDRAWGTPTGRARGKACARLLAAAAAAGLLSSAYAQTTPQGNWSSNASMGLMRTETGAAFAAGKLYVIGGGLAIAESSSLVQEYDPRTDRWRERAALPMPLSHGGVAALNNKVYVVGGFLKNVHLYAQPYAFEYDPAKNTWHTLPWMKAARGSVGVVALNGTIQSAPFLPEPRSGGSAVLYHDRILLMGGECDGTKTFSQNEAYDPKTMRWTALAAMPGGRHGFCAVTDGRAVYVAGGSPNCGGGSSDTLMLFTSPTGGTS